MAFLTFRRAAFILMTEKSCQRKNLSGNSFRKRTGISAVTAYRRSGETDSGQKATMFLAGQKIAEMGGLRFCEHSRFRVRNL